MFLNKKAETVGNERDSLRLILYFGKKKKRSNLKPCEGYAEARCLSLRLFMRDTARLPVTMAQMYMAGHASYIRASALAAYACAGKPPFSAAAAHTPACFRETDVGDSPKQADRSPQPVRAITEIGSSYRSDQFHARKDEIGIGYGVGIAICRFGIKIS